MKPSNKENGQNLDTEMFPLQSLDTWGSHKKNGKVWTLRLGDKGKSLNRNKKKGQNLNT